MVEAQMAGQTKRWCVMSDQTEIKAVIKLFLAEINDKATTQ